MSMRSTHKTHKTVIYSTSKDMFGILILLWVGLFSWGQSVGPCILRGYLGVVRFEI